jgi:hypothetical protein
MEELFSEVSQPLYPDPTPILTLPPDEPEPELNEEQQLFLLKRQKVQRCKVIALDKMNLHPINTNTSNLQYRQKVQLLKEVEILMDKPDDYILEEFNNICLDKVFTEDYVSYPVYSKSIPIPI